MCRTFYVIFYYLQRGSKSLIQSVPPGVSSSWGSWDLSHVGSVPRALFLFAGSGSELGSGSCSDLHAAAWGCALLKCLVSFPSGNVWEKTGKSALISQFTGVTLNLSLYNPSFSIHVLNKGIDIKLDTPLFKGGSFNEYYLSSAGLWPLNKKESLLLIIYQQ